MQYRLAPYKVNAVNTMAPHAVLAFGSMFLQLLQAAGMTKWLIQQSACCRNDIVIRMASSVLIVLLP